jgi:hypothetical protein
MSTSKLCKLHAITELLSLLYGRFNFVKKIFKCAPTRPDSVRQVEIIRYLRICNKYGSVLKMTQPKFKPLRSEFFLAIKRQFHTSILTIST